MISVGLGQPKIWQVKSIRQEMILQGRQGHNRRDRLEQVARRRVPDRSQSEPERDHRDAAAAGTQLDLLHQRHGHRGLRGLRRPARRRADLISDGQVLQPLTDPVRTWSVSLQDNGLEDECIVNEIH